MNCKMQEVFFCGLHHFKTIDKRVFCIHLIDEHDEEHGIHQQAGTRKWTVSSPIKQEDGTFVYGESVVYLGKFRYLPIFQSRDCDQKVSLWGITRTMDCESK